MIPDNSNEKENYKIEPFIEEVVEMELKSNQYYFENIPGDNSIEIINNNTNNLILEPRDLIELILYYEYDNTDLQYLKYYFKVLSYENNLLKYKNVEDEEYINLLNKPDIEIDNKSYKLKKKTNETIYFVEINKIGNIDDKNIFPTDDNLNIDTMTKHQDTGKIIFKNNSVNSNSANSTKFNYNFNDNKYLQTNNFIKLYYYDLNNNLIDNKNNNVQIVQITEDYNKSNKTLKIKFVDDNNDFLKKQLGNKDRIIFKTFDATEYHKKIIDKYQNEYSSSLNATNYMDHLIDNMNKKVKKLNKMIKQNKKKSQGNNQSIIYNFTKLIEKYKGIQDVFIIPYYEEIIKKIKSYDYNIESGDSFSSELDDIFFKIPEFDMPSQKLKNLHNNLIKPQIDEIINTNNLDIESIE